MTNTLSLPVRASGRQQHDLYDLPLSTTPAAAEQFRDAQLRLLRVQTGVVAPLQRAVALDPDFALGHAMLALVGHDLDLPIDPVTQLRAALGSVGRATARERSFVGAVSARIRRRCRAPVPVAAPPGRAPAGRDRLEHGGADDRLRRRRRGPRAGLGAGRGRPSGVRLGLVVRRAAGLRPAGAGPLRRGRRPGGRRTCGRAGSRARCARTRARLLRDGSPQRRAALDRRLDRRQPTHDVPALALLVARGTARARARRRDRGASALRERARARRASRASVP